MPNCHLIDPLVTPFVDDALSEVERRQVEEHLRQCPPCHSRVAAERAIHQLMTERRPALCGDRAPATLRTACAEMARRAAAAGERLADTSDSATPRPAALSWKTRVTPYALAASLVLGVGGAFLYQATDKSARVLAAELTADHMKCFAINGAVGTHDDSAVVESSMLSSFDWRMHLPSDSASVGLELVGSRQCLYAEGRIAHIMYRHQGHPVSLFMLPRTTRTQELVEVLGHEASVWCAGDRTFVLLAREPRQDVEQLAQFVKSSLH